MAGGDQHKALPVAAGGQVDRRGSQRPNPDPYQSPCAYEIRDGRVKAVKR